MAGTTADKLNGILASKEAIRQAIIGKGQECPASATLASYSSKIAAISTGTDFYECATVDTAIHTWTGYKLVPNARNGWSKAAVVTTGLEYTGPAPVVGIFYDEPCKMRLGWYYPGDSDIPDDYLFYEAFAEKHANAESGQAITYYNSGNDFQWTTVDGIRCIHAAYNNSSGYCMQSSISDGEVDRQNNTLSLWILNDSTSLIWSDPYTSNDIVLFGSQAFSSRMGFGLYHVSAGGVMRKTWAGIASLDDGWHHMLLTFDSSNSLASLYVDNELRLSFLGSSLQKPSTNDLLVGQNSGDVNIHLAALRYYNRVVTAEERAALAAEFTV